MIYIYLFLLLLFFCLKKKEHFNQTNEKKLYDYINWNELIFNCKNNLDEIYFFDKN